MPQRHERRSFANHDVIEDSHADDLALGSFEPLISEETFAKAQLHLSAKRPPISAYRRNNPDFPLRRFVRCGICDRSLSGGWTRGRSKRCGYYDCKSCQGVRIAKAELEDVSGAQ